MKTTRLLAACAAILTGCSGLYAQGWLGQSGNRLIAYNSTPSLTPLTVGIGVSSPTALFHTNGTLRFDGLGLNNTLTRVLVTDASGNVAYRDVSTLSSNSWLITGNTAGASDFIGTNNLQDFRFRTNGTQKMVLTTGGTLGINITAPFASRRLHLAGSTQFDVNATGDGTCRYHINRPDNSTYEAFISFNTNNTNYDWIIGTDNDGTGDWVQAFVSSVNGSSTRLITARRDGRMSIGFTYPYRPLATLDVNCGLVNGAGLTLAKSGLRLADLPAGTGRILVVDDSGYVYRSNQTAIMPNGDGYNQLESQLRTTQNEVENLKAELAALRSNTQSGALPQSGQALLYQNQPNPFSTSTEIRYFLPEHTQSAECIIYSMDGKQLKRIPIQGTGNGSITIEGNELYAGMFIYSLVVDGKETESRRMILTR
ncbi:MAG: T9SS type A sorting domain-containing protein [Bacteroidetes bacterium]|nr:T9SS type A sorting domain-containing protein [Bacteroidota bacterium]